MMDKQEFKAGLAKCFEMAEINPLEISVRYRTALEKIFTPFVKLCLDRNVNFDEFKDYFKNIAKVLHDVDSSPELQHVE